MGEFYIVSHINCSLLRCRLVPINIACALSSSIHPPCSALPPYAQAKLHEAVHQQQLDDKSAAAKAREQCDRLAADLRRQATALSEDKLRVEREHRCVRPV